MKQKAATLLPQTIVKTPAGDFGTLLRLVARPEGPAWIMSWATRKDVTVEPCAEVQKFDIL